MQMKISWLVLVVFSFFSSAVWGCVAYPRYSWMDALERSLGATIVEPIRLGSVDGFDLVHLKRLSEISDENLFGRGRYVVAVEDVRERIGDEERSLAFWAGFDSAGLFGGGGCQYMQIIDYTRRYVMLLGVEGPYALEPIYSDDDEWMRVVEEFFAKGVITPRVLSVSEFRDKLTGIKYRGCELDLSSRSGVDIFIDCVSGNNEKESRPGGDRVILSLEGGAVDVRVSGDDLIIDGLELKSKFGGLYEFDLQMKLIDLVEGRLINSSTLMSHPKSQ